MTDIFRVVDKVAPYKSTVLVVGESGTGKELVARALHERSKRADRPFVAVNCGAIPETLLEAELFGHVKGAFTDAGHDRVGLVEAADTGTLFLDEVGELPLALQVKLLRFLQEGEIRRVGDSKDRAVDVRVVAATVRTLSDMVSKGTFREDLYYRLNVLQVSVPPLRARREDIPVLVDHFLEKCADRLGRRMRASTEALRCLMDYDWPGNVRELENMLERAVVLSDHEALSAGDFPERMQRVGRAGQGFELGNDFSLKRGTEAVERELIRRALRETHGNRTHAAKLLEISHRALLYKMKRHDLS